MNLKNEKFLTFDTEESIPFNQFITIYCLLSQILFFQI